MEGILKSLEDNAFKFSTKSEFRCEYDDAFNLYNAVVYDYILRKKGFKPLKNEKKRRSKKKIYYRFCEKEIIFYLKPYSIMIGETKNKKD